MTAGIMESMTHKVSPIARAIVEAVLAEQLGLTELGGLQYLEETTAVMEKKVGQMSRFMSLGIMTLTLTFDASAATRGHRFRDLPLRERAAHLARWRSSPVGPLRDFTMFWEKMTTFTYYCFREEAEVGHEVDAAK